MNADERMDASAEIHNSYYSGRPSKGATRTCTLMTNLLNVKLLNLFIGALWNRPTRLLREVPRGVPFLVLGGERKQVVLWILQKV